MGLPMLVLDKGGLQGCHSRTTESQVLPEEVKKMLKAMDPWPVGVTKTMHLPKKGVKRLDVIYLEKNWKQINIYFIEK